MKVIFIFFCVMVTLPPYCCGANILAYPYGHCINSHLLMMERVVGTLIEGGHHVTLLVPTTYQGPYLEVNFTGVQYIRYTPPPLLKPLCGFKTLKAFLEASTYDLWQQFQTSALAYCETLIQDSRVMKELKTPRFHLAVLEHVDYCSRILADYIDIPYIALVSQGLESVYPRSPAYLPTILSGYTDKMTMVQRLKNSLIYMLQKLLVVNTIQKYHALKVKYGLNTTLALYNTWERAAMKFVTGHHIVDYPGPLMPNVILVSDLEEKRQNVLQPDIQQFLDNSPDGVVYLSFGTMIRQWDPEWQNVFTDAFSRLPYQVLWKNGGKFISGGHGNQIKTFRWAYQPAILSHPNVVLFISHAGLNGIMEVSRAGKPVVVIPLFADQFYQARKLVERTKVGVELDIRSLTAEMLASAILNVTHNKTYYENAQATAEVMSRRVVSDKDLVRHWVDFISSHQGAHHIQSEVQLMAWYEVALLDVACLGILVCGVFLALTFWLMSVGWQFSTFLSRLVWSVYKVSEPDHLNNSSVCWKPKVQ